MDVDVTEPERDSLALVAYVSVLKVVLVVCCVYIGAAMPDGYRYLVVLGLLAYSALRYYFPSLSRRIRVPR